MVMGPQQALPQDATPTVDELFTYWLWALICLPWGSPDHEPHPGEMVACSATSDSSTASCSSAWVTAALLAVALLMIVVARLLLAAHLSASPSLIRQ